MPIKKEPAVGPVTKAEIEQAAFRCFSEKGYHATMADISGSVHLKAQSLYSHFPNKRLLFEKVIRDEINCYFSEISTYCESVLSKSSCHIRLKKLYFFTMEYFRMHGRIRFWRQIPLLGREALLLSPLLEAMKSSEKALTQRVRCYIAEGFASGELMYGSADEVLLLYQCVIQGSLDSLLLSSDEAVRDGMQARIWSAFEKLLMTSGGM